MGEAARVGDRVRLTVSGRVINIVQEGLLLEPVSPDCISIKLVNGYNVTHPESDVESIELIHADSTKNSDSTEISDSTAANSDSTTAAADSTRESTTSDSELPLIVLLHTGGTIASRVDYTTGAVTARFEPEEIISAVPELADIARIRAVKLGNMWSDDMRPRHWNKILEASAEAFESGAVGVVITHGTDTLHLTAAAMAFGWAGAGGKPPGRVVLTGSQRSSDRGSSDAAENLIAAVHWAAKGPEVNGHRDSAVVIMHEHGSDGVCSVIAGCAARKSHSSRRGAFESIDQPPIARIEIKDGDCAISLIDSGAAPNSPRDTATSPILFGENTAIAEFVANAHLHPRFIGAAIDAGVDALLIHGTGLGHLPIDDPASDSPENSELAELLERFCQDGGIAVVTSQCIRGPVNMDVYTKGREQQRIGLIGHGASAPPAIALVKLHHLISRGFDSADIRSTWPTDMVGENPESIRE
jgi:glutamyl-tRNA(Gln) amidotransferase subunit D